MKQTKTQLNTTCTIYFDGSCVPNPGLMGIGAVIIDNSTQSKFKLSKYINQGTNNKAEFSALYVALMYAIKLNYKNAVVYGDSQLTINTFSKNWKIKSKNLISLKRKIDEALTQIECKFYWIPREQNNEADLLSNPNGNIKF